MRFARLGTIPIDAGRTSQENQPRYNFLATEMSQLFRQLTAVRVTELGEGHTRWTRWYLLFLVALLSTTALPGCYAGGMLWYGLTNVNHSEWERSGELQLVQDVFLIRRTPQNELVPPGENLCVPCSIDCYRHLPGCWPNVAIVQKGTCVELE